MVYQKKYSWRNKHFGVPAQVVGETMERIEERDGVLTKESFLEESRPEESPTHNCFEWDDTTAAEQFRLYQSRMIINEIVVNVVKVDGEKKKAPAFVNVAIRASSDNARYSNLATALSDAEKRKIVLKNALQELKTFERKYSLYKELGGIFESIREVERFVESLEVKP